MNREQAQQLIDDAVQSTVEALGPANLRVHSQMEKLAARAFEVGRQYGLMSLLTAEDVAARFGITPRRIRARARLLHDRFGIGYQVPGTNQWLFTPEELVHLRPGSPGRPRSQK